MAQSQERLLGRLGHVEFREKSGKRSLFSVGKLALGAQLFQYGEDKGVFAVLCPSLLQLLVLVFTAPKRETVAVPPNTYIDRSADVSLACGNAKNLIDGDHSAVILAGIDSVS